MSQRVARWIAPRSLSSGAHSRDPLARNDELRHPIQISNSTRTHARVLAALKRPSFRIVLHPRKARAQGRPGARCTRGLVCNMHKEKRTRAYRFSGNTPAFPAQWFYGLLRALLGDRLSCHRHDADCSTSLSASIGAPEPHDFAVRIARVRLSRATRPPHLTATFVTIAIRPSLG